MPESQAEIAAHVASMPEVDEPGKESKFTGPEPQVARQVFEEILTRGQEGITQVVNLVHDSTDPDFKDYRAQYVLHGLVVYVAHPDRAPLQRMVVETLASHLGRSDLSRGVRGLLLRELQWVGGPAAIAAIGGQLQDEELGTHAVSALTAIGPSAAEVLRRSLPQAQGRNRLAIIQALGVLGDAGAIADLKGAAHDESRDVRIAAIWSLANIGDAGSADLLIKASDTRDAWERIRAATSCLLLADKLLAADRKADAARVYSHLHQTRQDPTEQHVREAAARGLAAAK
ncbi:MAG: HEAT repeat domain-containing protein [Phycisphaerae bacterium]|nr:HEAT repeat domain-containing protein [Phycisphaerae bacterium]